MGKALAFFLRRWLRPYLLECLGDQQIEIESFEGRAKLLNLRLDCEVLNDLIQNYNISYCIVRCELKELELQLSASARKGVCLIGSGACITVKPYKRERVKKSENTHFTENMHQTESCQQAEQCDSAQGQDSFLLGTVLDAMTIGGIRLVIDEIRIDFEPDAPVPHESNQELQPQQKSMNSLSLNIGQMRLHVSESSSLTSSTRKNSNLNSAISSIFVPSASNWQFRMSNITLMAATHTVLQVQKLEFSVIPPNPKAAETMSVDALGRLHCGHVPGAINSSAIGFEIRLSIPILQVIMSDKALSACVRALRDLSPHDDSTETNGCNDLLIQDHSDTSEVSTNTCMKSDVDLQDNASHMMGETMYFSTKSHAPSYEGASRLISSELDQRATMLHFSIDCVALDWFVSADLEFHVRAYAFAAELALLPNADTKAFSGSIRSLHVTMDPADTKTCIPTAETTVLQLSSPQDATPALIATILSKQNEMIGQEQTSIHISTGSTNIVLRPCALAWLRSISMNQSLQQIDHVEMNSTTTPWTLTLSSQAMNLEIFDYKESLLYITTEQMVLNYNNMFVTPKMQLDAASLAVIVTSNRGVDMSPVSRPPVLRMQSLALVHTTANTQLHRKDTTAISCGYCAIAVDEVISAEGALSIQVLALLQSTAPDRTPSFQASELVESQLELSVNIVQLHVYAQILQLTFQDCLVNVNLHLPTTISNIKVHFMALQPMVECISQPNESPTSTCRHTNRQMVVRSLTSQEEQHLMEKLSSSASHSESSRACNSDFRSPCSSSDKPKHCELLVILNHTTGIVNIDLKLNSLLFSYPLFSAILAMQSQQKQTQTAHNAWMAFSLHIHTANLAVEVGQGLMLSMDKAEVQFTSNADVLISDLVIHVPTVSIFIRKAEMLQGRAVPVGKMRGIQMKYMTNAKAIDVTIPVESVSTAASPAENVVEANIDSIWIEGCVDALQAFSAAALAVGGTDKAPPSRPRLRLHPNQASSHKKKHQSKLRDPLLLSRHGTNTSVDVLQLSQFQGGWLPDPQVIHCTEEEQCDEYNHIQEADFLPCHDENTATSVPMDIKKSTDMNLVDPMSDHEHGTHASVNTDQHLTMNNICDIEQDMELAMLLSRPRPNASGYLTSSSYSENAEPTPQYGCQDAWLREARDSSIQNGDGRWFQALCSIPMYPQHFVLSTQRSRALDQQPPTHAPRSQAEVELPINTTMVLRIKKLQVCIHTGETTSKSSIQRDAGKEGRSRSPATTQLLVDSGLTITLDKYDRWVNSMTSTNETQDFVIESKSNLYSRLSLCFADLLVVLEPVATSGVPRRIAGSWRARTTILQRRAALQVSMLTTRQSSGVLSHAVSARIQPLRLYLDGLLWNFLLSLSAPSSTTGPCANISSVTVAALPLKIDHCASLPSLSTLQPVTSQTQVITHTLSQLVRLVPIEGLTIQLPAVCISGASVSRSGHGLVGAITALSEEWGRHLPNAVIESFTESAQVLRETLTSTDTYNADNARSAFSPGSLLRAARHVSAHVFHVSHIASATCASMLHAATGNSSMQLSQPRNFQEGITQSSSIFRKHTQNSAKALLEVSMQRRLQHSSSTTNTLTTTTALAVAGAVPKVCVQMTAGSLESLSLLLRGIRNSLTPEKGRDEEDHLKCSASIYPYSTDLA